MPSPKILPGTSISRVLRQVQQKLQALALFSHTLPGTQTLFWQSFLRQGFIYGVRILGGAVTKPALPLPLINLAMYMLQDIPGVHQVLSAPEHGKLPLVAIMMCSLSNLIPTGEGSGVLISVAREMTGHTALQQIHRGMLSSPGTPQVHRE